MRTLWNALSFLAIVHLLTLGMLVGWLYYSDRLDEQRLEDLRALFAPTIPEARAVAVRAAEAEANRRLDDVEVARGENPPLPAADQLRLVNRASDENEQTLRRLADVKEQFQWQLEVMTVQLEQKHEAIEALRRAHDEALVVEEQKRADTQFAKAVKLLESLPPKQAKAQIKELVGAGMIDQAVAYLDAMNPRSASKVLGQFNGEQEERLATELLERLRTYGVRGSGTAENATDAKPLASAGQ